MLDARLYLTIHLCPDQVERADGVPQIGMGDAELVPVARDRELMLRKEYAALAHTQAHLRRSPF